MSLDDLNDIQRMLDPLFLNMEWAEEEIAAAQERHPEASDQLWRSFKLLASTHPLMSTEFVYRSHCHELLERVAQGGDTTLGTAAECCLALRDTSLQAPLKTRAVGLYARMWRLAQFPSAELNEAHEHYEAIAGSQLDDNERWLRAKLRQPWRTPEAFASDSLESPLQR